METHKNLVNSFYQILSEQNQQICGLTKEFNHDEQLIIFSLKNLDININMVDGQVLTLQKHHITVPNTLCIDNSVYNSSFHYTACYVSGNDTYIARVYFSRYGKYKFMSIENNAQKIQLNELETRCIISNSYVQVSHFYREIKSIITNKINTYHSHLNPLLKQAAEKKRFLEDNDSIDSAQYDNLLEDYKSILQTILDYIEDFQKYKVCSSANITEYLNVCLQNLPMKLDTEDGLSDSDEVAGFPNIRTEHAPSGRRDKKQKNNKDSKIGAEIKAIDVQLQLNRSEKDPVIKVITEYKLLCQKLNITDDEAYLDTYLAMQKCNVSMSLTVLMCARGMITTENELFVELMRLLPEFNNSSTCVHNAIVNNKHDILQIMLEHGKNVNLNVPFVVEGEEFLPLHLAFAKDKFSIFKLLIAHNAEVNIPDSKGITVLYKSCLNKKSDYMAATLQAGANFLIRHSNGYIAFGCLACTVKTNLNIELCEIFLNNIGSKFEKSAVINFMQGGYNSQSTPLGLACQRQDIEGVKFLLAHGANPEMCDSNGNPPVIVAINKCNYEITEMLLKHYENNGIKFCQFKKAEVIAKRRGDEPILHLLNSYKERHPGDCEEYVETYAPGTNLFWLLNKI
jgi:ankyrin repeat protein